MAKITPEIRRFILETANEHPNQVIEFTSGKFDMSRKAAGWHVRELVDQDLLVASGSTRNRKFELAPSKVFTQIYQINAQLAEDRVWSNDIAPLLINCKQNVIQICEHGFTEILNNAIDHSESETVCVICEINPLQIKVHVLDKGVGIFTKIKNAFGLEHERHALLELVKGKLTTDKKNHTGEGIFFTSRIFDHFNIVSGRNVFIHKSPDNDWMFDEQEEDSKGTVVLMDISPFSERNVQDVFDKFAAPDEYNFSSTHVPVRLAKFGNENLVSRSQAKRVLARFEQFEEVMLDFQGVDVVGQAFADEIFRVFANAHPEIQLKMANLTPQVEGMIRRAKSGLDDNLPSLFDK